MPRFFKISAIMIPLIIQVYAAENDGVVVTRVKGDVKVRPGLEESWHTAVVGMLLKEIDTILALEGEVELKMQSGLVFRMGSNSILDISDLRKITRKEMFLYLMSEKVSNIKSPSEKTELQIGNVTVVHGTRKSGDSSNSDLSSNTKWLQEFNGAKALFNQDFYPNAVVKLHKILSQYSDIQDCGEIHFYLGKAFEKMDEQGQALDAFEEALSQSQNCTFSNTPAWVDEAQQAVERLAQ